MTNIYTVYIYIITNWGKMYKTFFVIPLYLQSVLVHSANCVKKRIQWHVEEYSLALLCD
jgi:hypothetical protein